MTSSKQSAMLDFLFDKEECKAAEDNLRTTLFSNLGSQRSFKEELFGDELPMQWKSEPSDFSVDDLLGSYFVEDDLPPHSACGEEGEDAPPHPHPHAALNLKEEDFEPFKDLVSLPFEAVMDSLDASGEAASDSGLSSDNIHDVMLSPSSESPDPSGDISIDTLDAVSDVSSTSDLGSMGSVGSSPSGGNGGYSLAPIQLDMGSMSPEMFADEDVQIKSPPVTLQYAPPKTTIFTTTTSASSAAPLPLQTSSPAPAPPKPSIATRSIKLELAPSSPRLTKPSTAPAPRGPILTKVRLDASSLLNPQQKISVSRTTSPQTIVVTQAGKVKVNPILRNGTLLKAGTGRSILLPVNVNDLNQVRTIKIISASSSNASTPRPVISTSVRNLVSTVRPISTSSSTSTSAPTRTTFYTTSKGSDGRSLLKVTPTAFVAPTAHAAEISRRSVTPSYIKEELSDDDEDTPLPNQELVLTDEERRLMRKEGLVLPSRYPLTKQEERDLKRIRRKIRNKISAQDSRKRKKEYVDGLEDRVKNCTDENQQLQKRLKTLEKQNETLMAQLKKFQSLVGGGIYHHNRPHNHASTALMMLILSAALFVVPSLRSQDSKADGQLANNAKMPATGHSRSLLEAPPSGLGGEGFSLAEDESDPMTFIAPTAPLSSHALSDHDYAPATKRARMDTSPAAAHFFAPPGVDKTLPRGAGDPPDGIGGLNGVAAMIGAMFDRLGGNWSDPGGHLGTPANNRTPPHAAPGRSSVVVNLNHGKRLRDDLELE